MATDDLSRIVLDYPLQLDKQDALRILREFRTEFPGAYLKWKDIEEHPNAYDDYALKDISNLVYDFLGRRCAVLSSMGAISAFGLLRQEVVNSPSK